MPQLENPFALQVSIGANDRVGVDQQVFRHLAHAGGAARRPWWHLSQSSASGVRRAEDTAAYPIVSPARLRSWREALAWPWTGKPEVAVGDENS